MTEVLIIEDEKFAAEQLQEMLASYSRDIRVAACLDTVEKSVKWLKTHSCDLIISDISLGDGIAFDIFERVKVQTAIIFTTAFDEYAIRAFKNNSVDYLLKPVGMHELSAALDKYFRSQSVRLGDLEKLISEVRQPRKEVRQRFMISSGNSMHFVLADDVSYFFAQDKYLFLVTGEGTRHLIDGTLEQLESQLDPKSFFRLSRKYIVNIRSVRELVVYSSRKIRVNLKKDDPGDMEISQGKIVAFKEWLNR